MTTTHRARGLVLVHTALALAAVQAQEAGTTTRRQEVLPLAPYQAAASSAPLAWEVRAADVTLARTLERWAADAGHKLKWDAQRNFLIGAPDVFVGSFEGALEHVLQSPGIRYSDYPLEACVYANTPPLVRITRQGEQTRECAPVVAR